ncbi:MAG: helix-turn-helix transcriptional regulator [Acidimicrobiales bacterium]
MSTTPDPLQQQARALGDPTRHTIFRYVAGAQTPVGVAELTAHLGLHHNAIRQHLAKLVASGLLEERRAPRDRPGRPRLVYRIQPSAAGRWGTAGPYERLSRLLAEVVRTGDAPVEVGRRAGRREREAHPTGDGALSAISTAMARQGFAPTIRTEGRRTEIVLTECPYAETAVDDRDTVCALHLGMAEGLASGTEVRVDQLVAKDPRRAGCRLQLRTGEPPPPGVRATLRLSGRRS